MKIQMREVEGGVKIVDFSGNLVLDQGRSALRQVVISLLNQGQMKIILNFDRVGHVDGAVLGELVNCWKKAQNLGSEIKLLNLSSRLRQIVEVTNLSLLFGEDYDDQRQAIASFREPSDARLLGLAPTYSEALHSS